MGDETPDNPLRTLWLCRQQALMARREVDEIKDKRQHLILEHRGRVDAIERRLDDIDRMIARFFPQAS